MKKNIGLVCVTIIVACSVPGCKNKSNMWASEGIDVASILSRLGDSKISLPEKKIKKPVYTISRKYLNERVNFKTVSGEKWKTGDIAVVGKDSVKLYTTVEGTEEVCDVPKGAILHLDQEIKKPGQGTGADEECPDFYQFNNETNYWYKTEYKGKKGFVFGSYLVFGKDTEDWESVFSKIAIDNDEFEVPFTDSYTDKLKKLSYYYTKPVKSGEFYNFNGRTNLDAPIAQSLKLDRIAVERVSFEEYRQFLQVSDQAGMDFPDDMIALYAMLHNDRMTTTFITTDLLVHSLHLIFDRMLQESEEKVLMPALGKLVALYYGELKKLETGNKNNRALLDSVILMEKYFLVAGDLMGSALMDKSAYPKDVKEELTKITAAGESSESPLFHYNEDYTQFIPRGHYTKNETLKKYFKAMMWFGRLHFYCVQNHPDKKINDNSIVLTRAALVLTKIAMDNSRIPGLWHSLYNPITYIVGESDDYNLDQYVAALKGAGVADFGTWIGDDRNIARFITDINRQLAGPAISGNTLNQSREKFSPVIPRGFRLFGQRFTLDGFIFTMLSSPRVGNRESARTMVKGLDVMAILGSKTADELLKEDRKKYNNFESNYTLLKNRVKNFDDNYWRNTFYRSYLRIIGEIANFDSAMPFYFTQGAAWNTKSLVTSHGAWAELKHDTLLYAKQSAAEKAGPGPCRTWDVDMLKRPVGYIEPNLGALYWIQSILEDSTLILSNNGFMSEFFINKFQDYRELIDQVIIIAESEAQDNTVTDEQNEFIYQIPSRLAKIVMPPDGNVISQDELKMAIIADVHTDTENSTVLEVGTGIPYRIYLALNDGNGGKRIATGYMFSYYEFERPAAQRLNDEQWKDMVYNKKDAVDSFTPPWAKQLLSK